MKVSYTEQVYNEQCKTTTAIIRTSLFAKYVCISLTFYHNHNNLHITFGIKENGNEEIENSHQYLLNSKYSFYIGNRSIEQHLKFPCLLGSFSKIELSNEDLSCVAMAREISKAFISKFESIFETIRQSIINDIGKSVKKDACHHLDKMFFSYSKDTSKNILSGLDWDKLLGKSEITDAIKIIAQNNFPRIWPLSFEGENDVKIIPKFSTSLDESSVINLSSILAMELLKDVVGYDKALLFKESGILRVENKGYKCILRAGDRVEICDPHGNRANACIHTRNFSCHPIDEVIISYLNITNCFEDWLKTANIFGHIEMPWEQDEP